MNEEQMFEQLLKTAGKRRSPPAEIAQSIKEATKKEWLLAAQRHHESQRQEQTKPHRWLAYASVLVLCVGVTLATVFYPANDMVEIAHVDQASGLYTIVSKKGEIQQSITANSTVTTNPDSQLVVLMPDHTKLVLDQQSTLRFIANNKLKLIAGKLYFDSPDSTTSISVETAFGDIVDIGTQYQVRINEDSMDVAVREGIVQLSNADQVVTAQAEDGMAEVVSMDKNGDHTRSSIPTNGQQWQWVLDTEPTLHLNGLSVHELMSWSQRITGKHIKYDSEFVEMKAKNTYFSGGRIEPKSVEVSIPNILKTTSLRADISEREIRVAPTR